MLQQIDINDLKPGMFVNNVIEQSGMLKIKTKGMVNSAKSIQILKAKGVQKLEIDLSRSKIDQSESSIDASGSASQQQSTESVPALSDREQLDAATQLYNQALTIQSRFFKRLEAKDTPSLASVKDLSLNIIDSVVAMPNGLSCLSMMNKTGKYLLEHSLNCSIFLTMFAQHRNMSQAEIESISMAGLLMDVGMTNMPNDITQSTKKLTDAQKEIVTTHVDIGLDLIDRCGDVSDIVRDIIFNHHERIDGSGYPDSQNDVDVSVYARMAAIVDSYDAMISERLFKKALTPSRALSRLLKDPSYDQALVTQFIQCVGVHPVGSLVKLNNGRLAIVIRGNSTTPLQPTVSTFYHIKTANYSEVKTIDLSRSEVKIESSVRPEEFGLNLTKFFKDVFSGAL
ncbi:HD-GYP domain-containing protein [Aliiglaciecola litoralis]|uniref:HD-GYP domain-containing protein n=1 Tax=Aliiglaciecola litoralis TaxID=582857 RepID=A0ABN1LGR9_9ALTE